MIGEFLDLLGSRGEVALELDGRNELDVFVNEVEASFEVGKQVQQMLAERGEGPREAAGELG